MTQTAAWNTPSKTAKILTLAGLMFIAALSAHAASTGTSTSPDKNWHSLEDIKRTASEFIEKQAVKPGQRTTVSAGHLDDRLKLQACNAPLEAYLPPGSRIGTNSTVGVRCSSPKKWKLFVPVRVGVSADVLVFAKPLAAGTVVNDSHIHVQERDLSTMRSGYIRAGEQVNGLVLKRRVSEGDPLRNELLTAPKIVRRGQTLTIESGSNRGAVRIRMAGTALSDGHLGQRIRVKNRSSGRTIEGIVRSSESVEIGY